MKYKNLLAAAAVATAAVAGGQASAAPLTLDTGWQPFSFGVAGTGWSEDFTFTIATTAYFQVTDAFCTGDVFSFSAGGSLIGSTSTPGSVSCDTPPRETDPVLAYASSEFSSGELQLAAGSYTITGTVTASPWGSGGAFVQLSSTSLGGPQIGGQGPGQVPLPAAGWMLLAGLGGLAGLRRARKG